MEFDLTDPRMQQPSSEQFRSASMPPIRRPLSVLWSRMSSWLGKTPARGYRSGRNVREGRERAARGTDEIEMRSAGQEHAHSAGRLDDAVDRAAAYLLTVQNPSGGYWVGELEADSTLTSEYLMLRRFIGKVDPLREKKAVRYLIESQSPDGSWNIFHDGPGNISATVKAYFALKLCGVPADAPFMANALRWILAHGGAEEVNVFTRIALALFGQFSWRAIPVMPVELILLPRWFYFNIFSVSYWSRTVMVPLLIIYAYRPLRPAPPSAAIDELFLKPRDSVRLQRDRRWMTWRNVFLLVDALLRWYDRHHLKGLRRRAITRAAEWMVEHMRGSGGLGAIYPAMANSVVASLSLGRSVNDPLVSKALGEIEELEISDEHRLHLQPCHSPIWDTCLTINTLVEAGFDRDHPALVKASEWMLNKQIRRTGDWQAHRPHAQPGGWYFQFENELYPDIDDTAVVLMALGKVILPDEEWKRREMLRGFRWLLAMQGRDGGWGSFDADNNKLILNHIPFADHGALLDPSTADLTGRALEAMGVLGFDVTYAPAARGIAFLKANQETTGAWYGRWGVNYLYGTWSALAGLRMIHEEMDRPYIRRAAGWLISVQNEDGGWGETCESYTNPALAGVGPSTASQTAWAVMGLLHAGQVNHPAVRAGIDYLLRHQQPDGAWEERAFTGTGFPRVFYLRYHMYCKYFPLWALALYGNLSGGGQMVTATIRDQHRLSGFYRVGSAHPTASSR
jgi:squalene-hopene/tetraprenyl-beta-curcumene cyclase